MGAFIGGHTNKHPMVSVHLSVKSSPETFYNLTTGTTVIGRSNVYVSEGKTNERQVHLSQWAVLLCDLLTYLFVTGRNNTS